MIEPTQSQATIPAPSNSVSESQPPPPSVSDTNKMNPARKFQLPPKLALPSKIAIPLCPEDNEYLAFSFLPVSDLKGKALFNAFCTFASHSENNAVLVSRAFVSNKIKLQQEGLCIRQVSLVLSKHPLNHTLCRTSSPFCHTRSQLGIFRKTSKVGHFRIDWLFSKYRNLEWLYNVTSLKLEGYKLGKSDLCIFVCILIITVLSLHI